MLYLIGVVVFGGGELYFYLRERKTLHEPKPAQIPGCLIDLLFLGVFTVGAVGWPFIALAVLGNLKF